MYAGFVWSRIKVHVRFGHATPEPVNADFAQAVADGLSRHRQKFLRAWWLYDEVGSALFEAITVLPEYGLTRADGQLLERAAGEIVRAFRQSGSSC